MTATGLDILLRNTECLHNRSIGLIVNQTSLTPDLRYSWNILKEKALT